jgi:hypothetical protein
VDKFFLHFLIRFNSALKGILKKICHKKSLKNQENYSANFRAKLKLKFGRWPTEGRREWQKPKQYPSLNFQQGLMLF